jgi:hypothetical protein
MWVSMKLAIIMHTKLEKVILQEIMVYLSEKLYFSTACKRLYSSFRH